MEIRGCSIHAVELIRQELKHFEMPLDDEALQVNSTMIDFFLWEYRRRFAADLARIPYHKVRCIYYWKTVGPISALSSQRVIHSDILPNNFVSSSPSIFAITALMSWVWRHRALQYTGRPGALFPSVLVLTPRLKSNCGRLGGFIQQRQLQPWRNQLASIKNSTATSKKRSPWWQCAAIEPIPVLTVCQSSEVDCTIFSFFFFYLKRHGWFDDCPILQIDTIKLPALPFTRIGPRSVFPATAITFSGLSLFLYFPAIDLYLLQSFPPLPTSPPPAINTTVHVLVNEGTRRWCRLITGAGRICCSFPPILLLLFFHIRFVWMFCLNVQSSTKGKTWGKTKYLFILNVGKRKQLWQWLSNSTNAAQVENEQSSFKSVVLCQLGNCFLPDVMNPHSDPPPR